MPRQKLGASFRDPSGFVFRDRGGTLLRYVSQSYQKEFDFLHTSGLYDELWSKGLLIKHEDYTKKYGLPDKDCYKILKPKEVEFISYPYEWSFSQLKDAALTKLQIQKNALSRGMVLKDASAYNMQFYKGRPILIDSLSFDIYEEGKPWVAYRQFCQHFLAPLALASYVDIRLLKLLGEYIDGIPLDLASSLLPRKTKLKPQLAMHIHLHARSQRKHAHVDISKKFTEPRVSPRSLKNLIDSLESVIGSLKWQPTGTQWGDYYDFTNYSSSAFKSKADLVKKFLRQTKPETVWDMGANVGEFSRLASDEGILTVAFDVDPAAVEKNYLHVKEKGGANILPLVLDLTNPSPAIGWDNDERQSIKQRGPADTVLALALIHHLAISNNLPFENIAGFFAKIAKNLIVEFVPKEDSQVQKLLFSRKNIFPNYNQSSFESVFGQHFDLLDSVKVKNSKRTIYLFKAK